MNELTSSRDPEQITTNVVAEFKLSKSIKEFNQLLSTKPPKKWLNNHPFVKIKHKDGKYYPLQYLKTEIVKRLMKSMFYTYRIEIREVNTILNSVAVTVRLHYPDPILGQWTYQDGAGAVAIQMDAGASPNDLSKIKSDGVMKGFPAAKTYAFKNAAKEIGIIFGSELNSEGIPDMNPVMTVKSHDEILGENE